MALQYKCEDEGDKDRFYQQLEYVFDASTVFRRAQFDTDHRLLVAKLRITIRSKRWPSVNLVFDIVSYGTSRPWKSSAARSEDRGS